MDTTIHINKLVWFYILLLGLYLISRFSLEAYLPVVLQDYMQYELEIETSFLEDTAIILLLVVVFAHLSSLFGLLRYKLWSKNLFIYTTVVLHLATPFYGPYIEHGVSAFIEGVSLVVSGAIVVLLSFAQSAFNNAVKEDAQ